MSQETDLIRLSQVHLNLLETCPPLFQRQYLEQLDPPLDPQQMEKGLWGSQFHLLMQQQDLGLSLKELDLEDKQLIQSAYALIQETASLWQNNYLLRESEHHRTLSIDNYLLTVIYDLLLLEENQAQILDWKTYPQPEKKDKLAKNWQTRLYLYLLTETSDYLPEQISMTYWFVKLPEKPKFITFKYNAKQHQKTHQDLQSLLNQLSDYLVNYEKNSLSFVHLSNCEKKCPYAKFLLKSEENYLSDKKILQDIEMIEEIPI